MISAHALPAGRRQRSQFGFTLIELLVVFTLLALLLTIAVPRYLETAETSRVKVREQNMATIRDALDKFKADQGHFPSKLEELVEKRYLRKVPLDPVTDTTDWIAVENPAKLDTGVFDIAAPAAENVSVLPTEPSAEVATPIDPGAMPTPNGAVLAPGGTMPTPMSKSKSP